MAKKQSALSYLNIVREHLKLNCVCLFLLSIYSVLSILYPYFIQNLIDEGIAKSDTGKIIFYAAIMLTIVFANIFIGYLMKIKYVDLGQRINIGIKQRIIACIDKYTKTFFDDHKTGDIISILENDVKNVQTMYTYLISDFLSNILILAGITLIMAKKDLKITVVIIGLTVLFSLWQRQMGIKVKKRSNELSISRGELVSFENDYLSNYYSVKNLGKTDWIAKRLFGIQKEVFSHEKRIAKTRTISGQSGFLFQNLCLVLAFIYGGINIMRGDYTVGTLFSMVIYIQKLYAPILSLFSQYMEIQKTQASVNRVNSVINQEKYSLNFGDDNYPKKRNITISNLNFGYGEKRILDEFSLKINEGDKCAIIGANGKGKTTFINILLRALTNYEGEISIDDIDILRINDSEYRKHVVGLSQKVAIFPASIRDNITLFNDDFDNEEVVKALKMAGAYEDVNEFPLGIETVLGKNGVALSAGQAQKIHLARLFLLNPDIIILDEPTSSLDINAEKELFDNLFSYFKEKTVIVISHRRRVLEYCNRVIDFDGMGDLKSEGA